MSFRIQKFVVGPLPNNLYLLTDDAAHEAVLVDPSIGSEDALALMQQQEHQGTLLTAIWNTHGHFDHTYDNARWKSAFPVPLWMHSGDLFWTERLREQAIWFGLPAPDVVTPDCDLASLPQMSVGSHHAAVLHVPGHSPGSVAFYFEREALCISGDVLFRDSAGRTDLPGCSADLLHQSLGLLCSLPADTRILPGHGEETTVRRELADNPYCAAFLADFRRLDTIPTEANS